MSFSSVVERIRDLSQNEGLRDDEIAKIIGCSRATVNRERIKNNIPTANLNNRRDKEVICKQCCQKILIRRNERKKAVCSICRSKTSVIQLK